MTTVKKTGFGPFGRTIVDTGAEKLSFAKSADVRVSKDGVCVTERHLVSKETTCFPAKGAAALSTVPAKSVDVTTVDGETRHYQGRLMALTHLERHGDEVRVVEKSLAGSRVVDRIPAADINSVRSDACTVCSTVRDFLSDNQKQ